MSAPSPLFACVLALSSALPISAQGGPLPEILSARRHLLRGEFDRAAEQLEEVLAGDDSNGEAWLLLGRAFDGRGDWEDAVSVFDVASVQPAVRVEALYHAARVYAREGQLEDALDQVNAALEAGLVGAARFYHQPEFAALCAEPEFRQVVPPPPSDSELFLERPRVLHTFYGEAPGDVFGWIGRDLGDADGDGLSDLLISAPYSGAAGPVCGKIYVYSGASGKLLFERTGQPGEQLGIGIESAGDVNGDGHMDAICGAANVNVGPGSAYVYSGRDGSTLLTLTAGEPLDSFGRKVSGGVDLDGDGHDDLLVGAPGTGPDGSGAGKAYAYSGRTGELLAQVSGERAGDGFGVSNAMWSNGERTLLALGAGSAGPGQRGRTYVYRWVDGDFEPAFRIEADETGVALGGMFVCFPGDMDGDGISEVYASDWQNGALGPSTGRIYVHSGASGERLFTLTGDKPGMGFGTCTADVGDVDGDGLADLLVGAWQDPGGAPGGGTCFLYSGADRTLLGRYTCTAPGETLGFDTTGVGDLDGDGGIDFLVTGGYSQAAGARAGRSFVIAGPVFGEDADGDAAPER